MRRGSFLLTVFLAAVVPLSVPTPSHAKFLSTFKKLGRKAFKRVRKAARRLVSRARRGVLRARGRVVRRLRSWRRAGARFGSAVKRAARQVVGHARTAWSAFSSATRGYSGKGGALTLPTPGAQSIADLAALSHAVYNLGRGRSFRLPPGYKLLHTLSRARALIQAIVVEHLRSGEVTIAFRGTEAADPTDLLADLGIAAKNVAAIVQVAFRAVKETARQIARQVVRGVKHVVKKVRGALGSVANKLGSLFGRKKKRRAKRPTTRRPSPEKVIRPQLFREGRGRGNKLWRALKKFAMKLFVHATLKRKAEAAKKLVATVLASVRKSGGARITRKDLVITGHSLGGYLAQVVGDRYGVRTETFNAPGARHGARNTTAPITNHIRRNDVVGRLGLHLGRVLLYPDAPYRLFEAKPFLLSNHEIGGFVGLLKRIWRSLAGRR